jgi:hypothetical protein
MRVPWLTFRDDCKETTEKANVEEDFSSALHTLEGAPEPHFARPPFFHWQCEQCQTIWVSV